MSAQNATIPTANEWINHAWQLWKTNGGDVSYIDITNPKDDTAEQMELKSQNEMEMASADTLQYYAGWMAFYSSKAYMWRSIYEDLEDRYKSLTNRYIAEYEQKIAMKKLEAMARAHYSELVNAVNIAKTKFRKYQTEYSTAETYRDTVSRIITLLDKERQSTWRHH